MRHALPSAAALAALAAAGLLGCKSGDSGVVTSVTRGSLDVRPVNFNPNSSNLGQVAAITDLADTAVVFSDQGMIELVAGTVSATDSSVVAWASAGVVPAADGAGQWTVGVDMTGAVYTVNADDELEAVSDRWGLLGQHVHEVAALGGASAAFLLDGQIAVADGTNVTSYTLPVTGLAGSKGRIAGVADGVFHVFDLSTGDDSAFKVEGAAFVTFDATGKLNAATPHALYGEDGNGGLIKLIDLGSSTVHGLAGSPSGVWVGLDTEVGLLTGATLGVSTGANVPADAALVASSSGDVWALSQGVLSRYSANSPGDESLWTATILPIFDRVCSQCHLPGGTANIDLSYYGAWVARRQLVGTRVFDKMPTAMPPTSANAQLTADDLTALKAWIDDANATGGGGDGGAEGG